MREASSFHDGRVRLYRDDCREALRELPDCSVDSVVTDPPYGLVQNSRNGSPQPGDFATPYGRSGPSKLRGFMGKEWDNGETAFDPEFWRDVLRVLKPGAHVLAFGGTRTFHRLACAIEDGGFEIRDMVAWMYGSGFPKSHDVSKGIDKAAGVERGVGSTGQYAARRPASREVAEGGKPIDWHYGNGHVLSAPATDAAREWQGWGTALKPSFEPLCFAQKPYEIGHLCATLAPEILRAICQLASSAKHAGQSSPSSPSASGGGQFGSAQWSAVAGCNTLADLFALMDTLPSALAIPSSLSTGLSWLSILDGLSRLESTFTTETRSSLTTDLRTLNCSPSLITPDIITQAAMPQNGRGPIVGLVESIFSGFASRLNATHALSVLANASGPDAIRFPEEAEFSPNISPICLARKPLIGTIAANVLAHGTGALNIDGCRVGYEDTQNPATNPFYRVTNGYATKVGSDKGGANISIKPDGGNVTAHSLGRWPANCIHDGSDEVVRAFPESASGSGARPSEAVSRPFSGVACGPGGVGFTAHADAGSGSAARFFYTAKADADDRLGSKHPTVKPLDLMQYLIRLITPKGGTVLDPFAGTGTTGEAALREGMRCILVERETEYHADIERRMELVYAGKAGRRAAIAKARSHKGECMALFPEAAE